MRIWVSMGFRDANGLRLSLAHAEATGIIYDGIYSLYRRLQSKEGCVRKNEIVVVDQSEEHAAVAVSVS